MGMDNIFCIVECDDSLWHEYEQFRDNSTCTEFFNCDTYEKSVWEHCEDICSFCRNYELNDFIESKYNLSQLEVRIKPIDLIACAKHMRRVATRCHRDSDQLKQRLSWCDKDEIDHIHYLIEELKYDAEYYNQCSRQLVVASVKSWLKLALNKNKKLIYICSI